MQEKLNESRISKRNFNSDRKKSEPYKERRAELRKDRYLDTQKGQKSQDYKSVESVQKHKEEKSPRKKRTADEISQSGDKNICLFCDAVYVSSHTKCDPSTTPNVRSLKFLATLSILQQNVDYGYDSRVPSELLDFILEVREALQSKTKTQAKKAKK